MTNSIAVIKHQLKYSLFFVRLATWTFDRWYLCEILALESHVHPIICTRFFISSTQTSEWQRKEDFLSSLQTANFPYWPLASSSSKWYDEAWMMAFPWSIQHCFITETTRRGMVQWIYMMFSSLQVEFSASEKHWLLECVIFNTLVFTLNKELM